MLHSVRRCRQRTNGQRIKTFSIFSTGVLLLLLFIRIKKDQLTEDLSEFWASLNISESFTMEFLDESIESSIVVLPHTEACKNGPTYLIIVISRTESFDIRDTIRHTWANPNNSYSMKIGQVVSYFLVGMVQNLKVMMQTLEESRKYNDMIVTTTKDHYDTLTLKVYAAMYFKQTYCRNVEYYIKVDDDVVLDVDRLIQQTDAFSNSSYIYGAIRQKDFVIRGQMNRYYMPYKCYPLDFYPPYAPGMMYILPSEAFEKIWRTLPLALWIRLEDVFYTGIVAKLAGVKRVNIGFMYSANDSPKLADRWKCDEHNRPKLAVASSFCNAADLWKFYRKLREIKCK